MKATVTLKTAERPVPTMAGDLQIGEYAVGTGGEPYAGCIITRVKSFPHRDDSSEDRLVNLSDPGIWPGTATPVRLLRPGEQVIITIEN